MSGFIEIKCIFSKKRASVLVNSLFLIKRNIKQSFNPKN